MRADLIKQISELKDINHIVVLTHNIDFVFLQTVFLSALKHCGHPGLMLFADAQCARESYQFQSPMITGLGRRFRVIPVAMNPGYRFHPKLVLLIGSKQGVLFVGSGNMTFGGMRENAEIWSRFDTDNGDFTAFTAVREYLNKILGRVSLRESVETDFLELFDERNQEWLAELGASGELIGRLDDSESLLSQMARIIGDQPISRITVLTPYFDPEGAALKTLSEKFSNPPTDVLIQSSRSTLFNEAAQSLPQNIKLKTVDFIRKKDGAEDSHRFIHAKYYAFQQQQEVKVFAGSANCSRAALLSKGKSGNAEMMSYQTKSAESFESDFLGELTVIDSMPNLLDREEDEQKEILPHIQLLGARFDVPNLRIGFVLSKNVKVVECSVDGSDRGFSVPQEGELLVRLERAPSSVVLRGVRDGKKIDSNKIWVDDESALRSTSRRRILLDRIRSCETAGGLQTDDWSLIVELFAKDLDYTTAREVHDRAAVEEEEENKEDVHFSRTDVFSDSYDKAPDIPRDLINGIGKVKPNIYNLLLHAFGIDISASSKIEDEEENDPNDDEDVVDRQAQLDRTSVRTQTSKVLTEREKRRITQVVSAITEAFTDPIYLELRDPTRLGTDLQIAGLLLRKGYSLGWIDKEQYFDATQHIWSTLFYSSSEDETVGWLSIRYQRAQNKEKFISALRSPQLAAILYTWATAIDFQNGGAYLQRFLLSLLLSMGRFQWLWFEGINEEETYLHILKVIEDSPCGSSEKPDLKLIHDQRIAWLRQGEALDLMVSALKQEDLGELRSRKDDQEVSCGDILWQGKRGICIALEGSHEDKSTVDVMCLQDLRDSIPFDKNYLMPVRQLLLPNVLRDAENFGERQRSEVNNVLKQLTAITG